MTVGGDLLDGNCFGPEAVGVVAVERCHSVVRHFHVSVGDMIIIVFGKMLVEIAGMPVPVQDYPEIFHGHFRRNGNMIVENTAGYHLNENIRRNVSVRFEMNTDLSVLGTRKFYLPVHIRQELADVVQLYRCILNGQSVKCVDES